MKEGFAYMNVLFFLTHKSNCTYIYDDFTIRQALERMEQSRFATIPILKRTGEYIGTISEGDLLWAIKNLSITNVHDMESHGIMEIAHRRDNAPVTVDTRVEDLMSKAIEQNFVPVVDDRNTFIGIITRRAIMQYCMDRYIATTV